MDTNNIVGRVSYVEARGMIERCAWRLHAIVEHGGEAITLIRNAATDVIFEVVEPPNAPLPEILDPGREKPPGPWPDA